MNKSFKNRGFTLVEVLLYIALLGLLLGGGVIAAYAVLEGSNRTTTAVMVQEEGEFLLRKFDLAMTNVSAINAPAAGSSGVELWVMKTGGTSVKLDLAGSNITITTSAGTFVLNSSNVTVGGGNVFSRAPLVAGKPEAVTANFTVTPVNSSSGETFTTTKYLRY